MVFLVSIYSETLRILIEVVAVVIVTIIISNARSFVYTLPPREQNTTEHLQHSDHDRQP